LEQKRQKDAKRNTGNEAPQWKYPPIPWVMCRKKPVEVMGKRDMNSGEHPGKRNRNLNP
jgi:hypothetical protein